MQKTSFAILLLVVTNLVIGRKILSVQDRQKAEKHNIVFIIPNDLGVEEVSCYNETSMATFAAKFIGKS